MVVSILDQRASSMGRVLVDGVAYRESTGTADEKEAQRFLAGRMAEKLRIKPDSACLLAHRTHSQASP